jgi:hypothetical protein
MTEKFELIGKWWFHDNQDKSYCGLLKYEPIKGSTLKIDLENWSTWKSELHSEDYIVHGTSINKKITMLKNQNLTNSEILILGNKHLNSRELNFKSYEVEIAYLNNWSSIELFNDDKTLNNRLPQLVSNINDTFSITLNQRIKTDRPNKEAWSVEYRPYLQFRYKEGKNYFDFKKDLLHFTNFISLAVDEGGYFESIRAYNDDDTFEIVEKRYFGAKDAKENTYNELFDLKDIINEMGFDKAIKNWYVKDKELLGSFSGLFFVSQYSKNLLEFEFLCLAQALDSLTTYYINEEEKNNHNIKNHLPPKEFDKLKEEIILSIESEDHKMWLKDALRNDVSFKKRINIILNKYQKILKISNKKSFATFIIKTRNAISHGSHLYSTDSEVKKGKELVELFYGVKMILTTVMLRIIDFDYDSIKSKLSRLCYYKEILNGKIKFKSNSQE